jgi:hypothetical protein
MVIMDQKYQLAQEMLVLSQLQKKSFTQVIRDLSPN